MGIFDWLGPLSIANKRAPWDFGTLVPPEQRSIPLSQPNVAFTVRTLVHGPGAVDVVYGTNGDASNSAAFSCLQAIATSVAEPELKVYRVKAGAKVEQPDTELGRLFARPNPHFSLDTLLAYVAVCEHVDGNAYWRKLRAGDAASGNVVELWPISPANIQPVTTQGTTDFISYYRYWLSTGNFIDLPPEQVVHFRYGLDDRDMRLGLSPLKRLVREISSDVQATRYADRLLANLAINGLTLQFDKDSPPIDQQTADELKQRVQAAYGGDNVGGVSVLSPGASLSALGFSPEQMNLQVLHRVPEERICAVLGVPAIVAGLGAGLDRSTYSNFREAEEAFTERKLLPLWSQLAATLTIQLLPDFTSDPTLVVEFDTTELRALADDQNALAERLKVLVEAGIIDVDEARAEIGYEARAARPTPLRAAARRPVEVRAVPRATKAAEDLPDRYAEQRAASLPSWERDLIAYLDRQQRRVTRRLVAGVDTADELVPEFEAVLLGETLTPLQRHLLADVEDLVAAELSMQFTVDDPQTRVYLREAGRNIVTITETTREAVRAELIAGQQAGEGIDQLARRLRALPAFNAARGQVVARTELGHAQIEAAYTSYKASGVVQGVRILDGDYDAACATRNGTVLTMEQAASAPRLLHPNCTAAWAPLTDGAELTASA